MRATIFLWELVFVITLTLIPVAGFAAGERHTGTVVTVGSDNLIVDGLGRGGREEKLNVAVTPTTRITYSERNAHASSPQELFNDTTIPLTDVKKGDFVVVETKSEGKRLVAESVTVTLRGSAK
jgi:hypothetical protein